MADLSLDGGDVVVHLRPLEVVLAWRREVRVPLSELRTVQVDQSPLESLSLWRFPGLAWPGSFALGSRRSPSGREFAAAYAGRPAVVLQSEGGRWQRVVVSHQDAVAVAAEVAAALLARGPGNPRGPRRYPGAFPASHE